MLVLHLYKPVPYEENTFLPDICVNPSQITLKCLLKCDLLMRSTFITLFKTATNLPTLQKLLTSILLHLIDCPEILSPTTFYTIKVFVILLIHYIFIIFLSQLEYKPHESRNLFWFTHWTHSFLNHMPRYIGPPIAWTNSDLWTQAYQLVQPRISLLFPAWYMLNVAWILRIMCESSFVFL